ncbi:MAG: TonB-dependent receptor, partial [Burkholderiales bacterium]|nr:TonB-dependent receptor [Burkholderiales bacterium]
LSGDAQFGAGFSGQLAYTYLDARFSDYVTVTGVDFSGKRIPGVPQNLVYAALRWQPAPTGFSLGVEGRYAARVYANDANTAFAPSYGIINLVAGWTEVFGPLRVGAFVRVDNVTDKEYIGSVIVNAANDRFFEPSPTRNVLAGVSMRYSF